MSGLKPPLLIRPLHAWFGLWERAVPSVYRVAAVVVAAFITAAALIAAGPSTPWWVATFGALVIWIGLAVVQEHDERVILPVDAEFEAQLREHVDPVLAKQGFVFESATGASRAHGGPDSFLYFGPGDRTLWILRDPRQGTLGFTTPFSAENEAETRSLPPDLDQRVRTVVDSQGDAEVVARVLMMWVEDPSLCLPFPPARAHGSHRLRGAGWFRYHRS